MVIIDTQYTKNILLIDMTIKVSSLKMGTCKYPLLLSASFLYSLLENVLLLFCTVLLAAVKAEWMSCYQNLRKFNMAAHWIEPVQKREARLFRYTHNVLSQIMSKSGAPHKHIFLFIYSF